MSRLLIGIIIYSFTFCSLPVEGEASDRIKIKKLLLQVEETVERIEDICQQIELLSEIAVAQAELGDRTAAHATFQRTVKLILAKDLNEEVRQKESLRISNPHWRIQMLTSVGKRQGETLGWKSSEKTFQQIMKIVDSVRDPSKDQYNRDDSCRTGRSGRF